MTERTSMESERAELLALADRHIAQIDYSVELQRIIEDLCHNRPIREPKSGAKHYYEMAVAYRLASQDQKPVAWQLRVKDGSYCRIIPDGELEEWKNNWANHLASGHAEIIPLGPIVSPPPAAGWEWLSEVIEEEYSKWASDKRCVFPDIEVQRSLERIYATLRHNAPPDTGAWKSACLGDISPGDPKDLAELLAKPSVLEPSDRTADVTVDDLAVVLANARRAAHGSAPMTKEEAGYVHLWSDGSESKTQARALLDAFTVGRR